MISLAALAIFAGLSLNLVLSFALGAAGVAGDALPRDETKRRLPLFQLGLMFVAVLFLWLFFSFAIPPYWKGFAEYFLFFPLSALVCLGLEFFGERMLLRAAAKNKEPLRVRKVFSAFTAYDGLVPASFMVTFILAVNFADALVLALFFALGNLTAMLILNEIRRRSTLEWVPRCLRGSPLILVSMGLLALISASAAGICFRILEVF